MALSFSKEIKIAGFASLEAVSALVFITGVVLTFSLTTDLLQKYLVLIPWFRKRL